MNKIHEYIELLKKQRAAKRDMLAAKAKITAYMDTYELGALEDIEVTACINRFNKVSSNVNASLCDDGGYEKDCSLFNAAPCPNRKCSHFADNLDYVVAKERYERALLARREFLRGFGKKRTK